MKLLIVDPFFTASKPTMRSFLEAYDSYSDLFDEIQVWTSENDLKVESKVVTRLFPRKTPYWSLNALEFQWQVSKAIKTKPPDRNTLVLCTGCNLPEVDVRYIHYWHRAVLDEKAKRPDRFKQKLYQSVVSNIVAASEKCVVNNSKSTATWWVVGRALGERIRLDGGGGSFRVLPNSFDAQKFNSDVRCQCREDMRRFYGFAEEQIVLVFSSFGHFERKGLLQAAEAVSHLQIAGYNIKLLVLGGNQPTISNFLQLLDKKGISRNTVLMGGLVREMERHLSAADAFIFPSHFEAFSLAEIEAGALGLRLYLTDHYGSEMILREPTNGRLLPWDPAGMAEVLEEDIKSGVIKCNHGEIGEALNHYEFGSTLRGLFIEAISRKKSDY